MREHLTFKYTIMNLPFEDMKLKFGIHKGKPIKDVPDNYLKFLLSKNILKGKLLFHCQVRFGMERATYKVTVTDSVGTDGTYIVKAYNTKNAINRCKKEYKIQGTQSYHGTEFDVEVINDYSDKEQHI